MSSKVTVDISPIANTITVAPVTTSVEIVNNTTSVEIANITTENNITQSITNVDIAPTTTTVEATVNTTTVDISPNTTTVSVGDASIVASNLASATNTSHASGSWITGGNVQVSFDNLATTADSRYVNVTGDTMTGDLVVDTKVESPLFKGDLEGAVHFKASGSNLAKGDVVYISGYQGNKTTVDKADASDSAKMPAFGIVNATQGGNVDILTFGSMLHLSTTGIATGTELYVSASTPGGYETSAPTGEGNLVQKIAKVVRGDSNSGSIKIMGAGRTNATPNLNNGNIFLGNASNISTTASFDTTFGTSFATRTTTDLTEGTNEYYTAAKADARISAASIGDLSDVDITTNTPTNDQVLVWSTDKFVPSDSGVDLTAFSVGDNATANGSGGLAYNNTSGVFTYTPPNLSSYLTSETTTSLALESNILKYTDETGTENEIDISLYLDDTNLARLTAGTLDASSGTATFTRSDNTTFTVDFSSLINSAEVNNLSTSVTWANVPNANITQSSVTQHQAALSINKSQIPDFGTYLTSETSHADVLVDGDFTSNGFMKRTAEGEYSIDNNTYITGYTVTQTDVTGHQAALSITESQISDLQSYLTTVAFADLSTTPTTLSGYGITDAQQLGQPIVSTSAANIELDPDTTGQVVFKGNANRGSGQLVLNCENNSHGITLKGPPHSAGASYTLVLPNDTGSNGQVLKSDGSGNLSWVSQTAAYTDSSVDTHLNVASASSGQVLSWNGSDYAWVADQTGGGGSARTVSVDTNGDGSVNNTLESAETLVLKAGTNVTLAESGGVVTIDSQSGSSVTIKDEDDMASDSATAVPSQQSVKAYVDDTATKRTAFHNDQYITLTNNYTQISPIMISEGTPGIKRMREVEFSFELDYLSTSTATVNDISIYFEVKGTANYGASSTMTATHVYTGSGFHRVTFPGNVTGYFGPDALLASSNTSNSYSHKYIKKMWYDPSVNKTYVEYDTYYGALFSSGTSTVYISPNGFLSSTSVWSIAQEYKMDRFQTNSTTKNTIHNYRCHIGVYDGTLEYRIRAREILGGGADAGRIQECHGTMIDSVWRD